MESADSPEFRTPKARVTRASGGAPSQGSTNGKQRKPHSSSDSLIREVLERLNSVEGTTTHHSATSMQNCQEGLTHGEEGTNLSLRRSSCESSGYQANMGGNSEALLSSQVPDGLAGSLLQDLHGGVASLFTESDRQTGSLTFASCLSFLVSRFGAWRIC